MKIQLSDISFKKEVETRLWLSTLTTDETHILCEIIHHSLHVSMDQLAEELSFPLSELKICLEKLKPSALFKIERDYLIIDKEERKYLAHHIQKFENHFTPDLTFIEKMLQRLPSHLLMQWYPIPRSCDHLFSSIVDLYFAHAKLYQQHLKEIEADLPPFASWILRKLQQSSDFTLSLRELQEQLSISHFEIETLILILEYHFGCFLSYKKRGNFWEEQVSFCREWREFLGDEKRLVPRIDLQEKIQKEGTLKKSLLDSASAFLAGSLKIPQEASEKDRVKRLLDLQWITPHTTSSFSLTAKGREWQAKKTNEKAYLLLLELLGLIKPTDPLYKLIQMKNIRSIEQALRKIPVNQWMKVEDFIAGAAPLIENKGPISLKNRGKKWFYERPHYGLEEKLLIEKVIFHLLADIGVVEAADWQGEAFFRLTSFGFHFIS